MRFFRVNVLCCDRVGVTIGIQRLIFVGIEACRFILDGDVARLDDCLVSLGGGGTNVFLRIDCLNEDLQS